MEVIFAFEVFNVWLDDQRIPQSWIQMPYIVMMKAVFCIFVLQICLDDVWLKVCCVQNSL